MKSVLVGIKNVLLWSYARGTWQYDLLCLGIILTVFLVPSSYFGDRDRTKPGQANEFLRDASKAGENYTIIEFGELTSFLEGQNRTDLSQSPAEAIPLYLRDKLKRDVTLLEFKPLMISNGKPAYKVLFK
jgi:hypothetical protein